VRCPAGFRDFGDQRSERHLGRQDTDGRDAHRRTIGIARAACLLWCNAAVDGIYRALGRWSKQVVAAAQLDAPLPFDESVHPALVIEDASRFEKDPAQEQGLFRVVRDGASRQPLRHGMAV
jgi:hypothetical protein